jgi:hypothetical protein
MNPINFTDPTLLCHWVHDLGLSFYAPANRPNILYPPCPILGEGGKYVCLAYTALSFFPVDWKLPKVRTVRKEAAIYLLGYNSGVLPIRSPSVSPLSPVNPLPHDGLPPKPSQNRSVWIWREGPNVAPRPTSLWLTPQRQRGPARRSHPISSSRPRL